MLTNKGKYGLKALIHLAGVEPGKLAVVSDIAATNRIPKKFLDAILGELRNAGLVQSRKGKFGGYSLARSPDEIMAGEIVRVLDGPLAPIHCASMTRYQSCDDCDVSTCTIRTPCGSLPVELVQSLHSLPRHPTRPRHTRLRCA